MWSQLDNEYTKSNNNAICSAIHALGSQKLFIELISLPFWSKIDFWSCTSYGSDVEMNQSLALQSIANSVQKQNQCIARYLEERGIWNWWERDECTCFGKKTQTFEKLHWVILVLILSSRPGVGYLQEHLRSYLGKTSLLSLSFMDRVWSTRGAKSLKITKPV